MTTIQTNRTPFHTCLFGGTIWATKLLSCVGFFRSLNGGAQKEKSLQVYELEGFGFGWRSLSPSLAEK